MKFKSLRRKCDTVPTGVQVQSTILCRRSSLTVAALAVLATSHPGAAFAQTSTSPLEILKQAPKVRFDDPDPTPAPTPTPFPRNDIPFRPPTGPAPAIEPVYPAITPYSGNSVSRPAQAPRNEPYYSAPVPGAAPVTPSNTPPLYVPPGPTPRPVLGPEDMEPKKKRGFVRGLINAIPFVGDDDDEEAVPTATPQQPIAEPEPDTPAYRGYEAPPLVDSPDAPLLLPPGAAPVRGNLPRDPEPSSPPILTPEPRTSTSPGSDTLGAPTNLDGPVSPGSLDSPSRPILTVKRESDTTASDVQSTPEPAGSIAPGRDADMEFKQPAVSGTVEETPRPLEKATTSVLIQDSRDPVDGDDTLGPQPDPSATKLESFDPTKPTPVSDAPDVATSLTIVQSDLGMPNPTYEPNAVILAEFQEAVRRARAEDYETAARLFREYGQNHPSSGLAPRAFFLSVIFEKNRTQARENVETMKRLFPESRYVKDVASRREDLSGGAAVAQAAVPGETPRQKVDRLERELTAAVGNVQTEPELRKDLGLAYLELEEYDRAYEVLRPALDITTGHPAEAEVLLAMGRVLVLRRETVQAISLFEAVEEKNPELIYKDAPSAWNVGLAFEGIGRYNKARTIYNGIRQKWPETAEAGWASARLNELAALAQ